jgi:hypothetical protein
MKFLKHLVVVTTAFAMTASPALAAGANAGQARASAPIAQSEQLDDEDGGGGWILYALLGIALAAGLILALDDPASP